jgi:actin-like ATPase involved in cell morphogenesis
MERRGHVTDFAPQMGVDLGTTHTVAALAGADGRSQPLLFDASFLLPSSVYAEVSGHLLVGNDAQRSAGLDPGRFEPNPKRRIDDGRVLLGSREYTVSDLLAALLRRAADEAARVLGVMPARMVLTYPVNWGTHRRAVLVDAAARAGLPAPVLVPEPVAAAAYFTTVLGQAVAPGAALLVYDFGGGTFDTTVLRRRPDDGWDVLASDGLPDMGGVDLDAAVVNHVGRALTETDAQRWHQLVEPGDDMARRRSRVLHEDVRTAKEQLSRAASAGIHVPLFDTDVYLTRDEFEQVARPYLQRTVDLTASTLQRAGMRPDQIAGLVLVGGSSRIPLVSTVLHQRLGIAPTLIEQPELVVALGSVQTPVAVPVAVPVLSVPPRPTEQVPVPPRARTGSLRQTALLVGIVVVVLLLGGGGVWRWLARTDSPAADKGGGVDVGFNAPQAGDAAQPTRSAPGPGAIAPRPTYSPTKPPASTVIKSPAPPKSSPPRVNLRPTIQVAQQPGTSIEQVLLGDACLQGNPTTTTVAVTVTDDSGPVGDVKLSWSGFAVGDPRAMTKSGDTWTGTIGPIPFERTNNGGTLTITVTATDVAGLSATVHPRSVAVGPCAFG